MVGRSSFSGHNEDTPILEQQLQEFTDRLRAALAQTTERTALEAVRVQFLGRSGEITQVRRSIGGLPPAERPLAGKAINDAVASCEALIAARERGLQREELGAELAESIDVTFPATMPRLGSIHPLRRTLEDAAAYFERRGFAVLVGPEIDTAFNNFDALNIPPDHPAREGFDSFYLRPDLLLRPHTSPMQIRAMQANPPPIAIVTPGKAFRRDSVDARHSYMFHQMEGLLVGPGIHMGHLKGMLTGMCRELFGPRQEVRFRPSFFPFTEPSAEVDTTCPGCAERGSRGGCRTCGGSGWIEIGGSGMIHPNVLRSVGYDPGAVAGWAFGIGIERIAMVRYGIDDIRTFFENDPEVLAQLA
ncbi:MAG: phenylalanine--tRNA ligase subunit alpha [Vulcanimicrobiaceae bacterium]